MDHRSAGARWYYEAGHDTRHDGAEEHGYNVVRDSAGGQHSGEPSRRESQSGDVELTLETIACPDCDLLQQIPPLPPGGKARCARCGETLVSQRGDPLNRPLALTVAATLAFIIANTMPLMSLSAVGRESSTTIIGGAIEMWREGSEITAVAVAICAVLAPAAHIAFLLVVLIAVRRPPAPRWVGEMLRAAHLMHPWSMTEVMMLGILVALVKIAQLATVIPGIGMYAAGAFIVLLAAVMVSFDPREIWKRVRWADGSLPPMLALARSGDGKAR